MSFLTWLFGSNEQIGSVHEVEAGNGYVDPNPDRDEIKNKAAVDSNDFDTTTLPRARQSLPTDSSYFNTLTLPQQFRIVNPEFLMEIIPVIRKLCYTNPDMSQALHNIVTLGNTGHKIFFDRGVKDDMVDEMRNHLINKHKDWAPGQANADGIVNRMISQLMISGAISTEWVPNITLDSIESVVFVAPETIRFKRSKNNLNYEPYQKIINGLIPNSIDGYGDLVKLNPLTYKYFSLNGDGELPYGIPPYMTGIGPVKMQDCMNENITFAINQIGLLGFLQVLVEKPPNFENKNVKKYMEELDAYLIKAREQVQLGFKDGAIVGFKDDHVIDFTSISRDFDKALSLFENNELQFATALKQDAALWGRNYNNSETSITVVFMKMLSELRNIQNIVKANLEFGYTMELRLAGYKFDYLTTVFNPSTIQDDLKIQQAREIKVRNLQALYVMGTINENQFADELGYEKPAEAKPRVPVEMLAGAKSPDQAAGDKAREDGKNKSDKKVRDKNKPQGAKK